jgi:hypothetical protein
MIKTLVLQNASTNYPVMQHHIQNKQNLNYYLPVIETDLVQDFGGDRSLPVLMTEEEVTPDIKI